jgi:hypothetical protein
MPVDLFAFFSAIAFMFGSGTVTPDTTPTLKVDSSSLTVESYYYDA